MPTIQQLVRKGRSPKVSKTKAPALKSNPQQAGVCTRVYTTTPEEAELGDAQGRSCEAPQRHRGHRVHPPVRATTCRSTRWCSCAVVVSRTSPGVRYKIVRGALDTQAVKNRKQARSRYGAKKG